MTIYRCTRCNAHTPAGVPLTCKDGPCPMEIAGPHRCAFCFAVLTGEEQHYYISSCHLCESEFNYHVFEPEKKSFRFYVRRMKNYLLMLLD